MFYCNYCKKVYKTSNGYYNCFENNGSQFINSHLVANLIEPIS